VGFECDKCDEIEAINLGRDDGDGGDREAQYLVKKTLAARFDAGIRLQIKT
jgi:hypothetical protein